MKRRTFYPALLVGLVSILAACGGDETATPITVVETVEVEVVVYATPITIPFIEQWQGSKHADLNAPAFRHWNRDDPAEVPLECARCHSEAGFLDFAGADESPAGVVDQPAPAGTVITCVACHNEPTVAMSQVTLPSGAVLSDLGAEARCLQCHQGRESMDSVNALIAGAGVDEDTVSDELEFIDIHGGATAAIRFGTDAGSGYEYAGNSYDTYFAHVEGYQACHNCHDPHTLKLKLEICSTCHEGVASVNDLHAVRTVGSLVDYDGDDDLQEGVYYEIAGLKDKLLNAMQAYALQFADKALGYNAVRAPNFFVDADGDGQISVEEAVLQNSYNAWTPRLLKAAYNFHLIQSDQGAYAHGGKYAIQLLWDSIENLNAALDDPVDLTAGQRIDHGHFAGSEPSFRNWDSAVAAAVPPDCSQCHSATGLPVLLEEGELSSQPSSNGLRCSTCHSDLSAWNTRTVTMVNFLSGVEPGNTESETNLCVTCHHAIESGASIQAMVLDLPADVISRRLKMIDLHTSPAGDTFYGSESRAGYQYPGKTYTGRFNHPGSPDGCTICHDAHTLMVPVDTCGECHPRASETGDLNSIRFSLIDFDGDDDTQESLADEIASVSARLYEAIQTYAVDIAEAPIIYDHQNSPYFFTDTNADGKPDKDEIVASNDYQNWTPRLLEAAYNYHYASKDPAGFAHNGKYLLQLLYDSLADLDGEIVGLVRP